jgi:hypothetical protein
VIVLETVLTRRAPRRVIAAALVACAATAVPAIGAAQQPGALPAVVRAVNDSLAPIPGASIALLDSTGQIVRGGSTDSLGNFRLIAGDTSARRVSLRRIGYTPALDSLLVDRGDTLLLIVLRRSIAVLDEVVTSARSGKNYSVGAADITASHRGLFTAFDVLKKLRPQMLGDGNRYCGVPNRVWINGRRIYFFPGESRPPSLSRHSVREGAMPAPPPAPSGPSYPSIVVMILESIHAGDLAEAKYTNCWDKQPEGIFRDALYIVLKPGVEWDWKRGSFRP